MVITDEVLLIDGLRQSSLTRSSVRTAASSLSSTRFVISRLCSLPFALALADRERGKGLKEAELAEFWLWLTGCLY
jgi:hypothetical protein